MIRAAILSFSIICAVIQLHAQGIVVRNATIHVGNGQIIENGILVTDKDKIVFVGNENECKIDLSKKETLDAKKGQLYPGLISLYSSLGLIEWEAIRASSDYYEIGDLNTHIRAGVAYNVDSEIMPTVRSNGVLITQVTPRGGLISGHSSAMYLNGWTVEESQVKADEGLHINWPEYYPSGSLSDEAKSAFSENRLKEIQKLKTLFTEAKAYFLGTQSVKNLRFEGLKGILNGSKTIYFAANKSKEILEIIAFVNEMGIKKPAIVGAQEALNVSEELAKNNIPVVLARLHNTPPMAENEVDYNYTLPFKLKKAGVKVALSYYGDMEAAHSRNLAFVAGTAAAYGLSKEEALATITSIPAQILGIDNQLGTLETGKQASFILSTGDVLDMRTSKVVNMYIKGEKVDLSDKQKELNQKYLTRYKLN